MNPRIFISYARSDGSASAEAMSQLLADNGHSAWQDLRSLGPEESVWPQIEKALKTAEFLIVLITPAALKSDYIRKEWREARRNGATIMPVMAMKQSRSTLPRWLRRGEVYDLKEATHREKFLARLNSTGGTFRADWDAGLEIETFIARPKLFAQIRTQLLSEASEPISLTSALQGRGGYGKSVLAGEIARDPEIRDAYIDGVFWVSLGQDNPDVLGQINHLIRRISGAEGAPDVNTAAEELRRLLEKRDVLIILDDVWRRQDLYPFAKATGHGNATLLATTRKLDALPPSAQTIDISGMEADEAVELLSYGLAPDAAEQQALSTFASYFWHWPQLLAIANGLLRGRMRDGETLLHALEIVADGARRGVVPGADERERTIANIMQMGIDDLPEPDRARFRTLVVVPEDSAIPVAILAPLWTMQQYEAEEFVRLLVDRRLIQSRDLSDPAVGARIRMHDDMLWYLGTTISEAEKRRFHSNLLSTHRPANDNRTFRAQAQSSLRNLWRYLLQYFGEVLIKQENRRPFPGQMFKSRITRSSWTDIGQTDLALHYIWRHLIWHLEQSGDFATATALRTEFDWIKAKLNLLGIDAVLADYRPTPQNQQARRIGKALALSRQGLKYDPCQLGFQLFGRLAQLDHEEDRLFIRQAKAAISIFSPVSINLDPPRTLLSRMTGHLGQVNTVAYSPDQRRIISGGDDGTLRFWDAEAGSALGEPIRGHEGKVLSAIFSPDGKCIVSGGEDATVRLWDAETGAPLGEPMLGHDDNVKSVAFSPDGKRIASGSNDSTLLWDASIGANLSGPMRRHSGRAGGIAFSPDSRHLIIGTGFGLRLWDIEASELVGKAIFGNGGIIQSVAFSPDGRSFASGDMDGMLFLRDLETGDHLCQPIHAHGETVTSVAFSPDGRSVVSGSSDGTLRLWETETGIARGAAMRGHDGGVNSVAFSTDGRFIISAGYGGTICQWVVETSSASSEPRHQHDGSVLDLAFSPDGKRIVSGGGDGRLFLWDTQTGMVIGEPILGDEDLISRVAFSPDGCQIAGEGFYGEWNLWDSKSSAKLGRSSDRHDYWVDTYARSPNGKHIVIRNEVGTLQIWDEQTSTTLGDLDGGHEGRISSVAFSPNGRYLVSGGNDRKIRLWNAETVTVLGGPMNGHEDIISSVAFSPDGSRIVSGSFDQSLQLWDAATGAALGEPLRRHEGKVFYAAFSPNGQYIVSAGWDSTLCLWDTASGQLVQIVSFDATVHAMTASSQHVAIGDMLGHVHILRWKTTQ